MICKNCGKEIDDDSKFCRYCGQQFGNSLGQPVAEQMNQEVKEEDKPLKNKKILGIAIIIVAAIVVALFAFVGNKNSLNEDEKLAYENALTMKNMLKDPDSFKLYDEDMAFVLIKKHEDLDNEKPIEYVYTVFKCGGTNSYGATVTTEEVFKDKEYVGTYEEIDNHDENRGSYSEDLKTRASVDFLLFSASQTLGGTYKGWELVPIDVPKIKKKLKIK